MLDSIRSLTDLPVGEDARLAREDIAAARRRQRLQREAQRRARECVEQARRDAEAFTPRRFNRVMPRAFCAPPGNWRMVC